MGQGFSGTIFALLHDPDYCLSPLPPLLTHISTPAPSCLPVLLRPHYAEQDFACSSVVPAPSHPRETSPLPQPAPHEWWQWWHLGHSAPDGAASPAAGQRAGRTWQPSLSPACPWQHSLSVVFLPIFCSKGLNFGTGPPGTGGHRRGL